MVIIRLFFAVIAGAVAFLIIIYLAYLALLAASSGNLY